VELVETVAGRLLIDAPGTNYDFYYEIPQEKVFVFADKKRLEQVLGNLIENAKKYVLPGGEIRLRVLREDNHIRFSICNQAQPLNEQELSKIWNKFYRGKNQQRKGSGLGLAIVSKILSMYQVPFGVFNQKDAIEFYFEFPTVN
jgi:signal transduction histidine kinase